MHLVSFVAACAVVFSSTPLMAQGWTFESLGVATYFDLAVESDGTPHIVYTNCTNREVCFGTPAPRYLIHLAKINGSWMSDTLATDPAGFTPAIAVDGGGEVHVVYADSPSPYELQYIHGMAGGPWATESLTHSSSMFRNEPAIAVDDTGGVHVSYNQGERLWYQYRSDSGWIEEQVMFDTADNDIARSSIAVGSDGVVRIAYWNFTDYGVLFEKIGGMWTQTPTGAYWGAFPSLALDSGDAAHILSGGYGNGTEYATNATGPWTQETLHAGGSYGDIVLTGADVPIVAYPAVAYSVDNATLYASVDLYYSLLVDGFWQRQSIVSYQEPYNTWSGRTDFRPRLAIDGGSTLHMAYAHPETRELVYGTRDVPTPVRRTPGVSAGPDIRAVPNPFNPSTTLSYTVPAAGRVRIDIFDVQGRRVRALVDAPRPSGAHAARWDGRNDHGDAVSSGIYFVRLDTPAGVVTRRAVLLK